MECTQHSLSPSLITKRRGAGNKLGEFRYKDFVTLVCVGGTQSLYQHKILRTYNHNFELYSALPWHRKWEWDTILWAFFLVLSFGSRSYDTEQEQ